MDCEVIAIDIKCETIKTPIGLLQITKENEIITSAVFVGADNEVTTNNVAIDDYFNGKNKEIALDYKFKGTGFQEIVWNEILKIPYGQTRTYSQIAEAINDKYAYRAVANACSENKLALIVPCHRVVGKNNLSGYKWGVDKKTWLLNHEKANI